MKTPVIIAAYNEADRIGATLRSLDRETTEPFVVVNGDEGREETLREAEQYTSHVYEHPEQGKLPAVQLGLRKLLQYDAEAFAAPIIFTDADTQPLMPKRWAHVMSRAVAGDEPNVASGVVLYNDGPFMDCALRNARRLVYVHQVQRDYDLGAAYGSNMSMNLAGRQETINAVMDAPHIWPGEDRYLLHEVSEGDRAKYRQLVSLGSAVLVSSRFLPPLASRFTKSRDERRASVRRQYRSRRASSVTHFFDDKRGALIAYENEA